MKIIKVHTDDGDRVRGVNLLETRLTRIWVESGKIGDVIFAIRNNNKK